MPSQVTVDMIALRKMVEEQADAMQQAQDPRMKVALEVADFLMRGKGEERHGHGKPWDKQPWAFIEGYVPGFCTSQALKKIIESEGLEGERRERELIGAAGYLILKVLKLRGEA